MRTASPTHAPLPRTRFPQAALNARRMRAEAADRARRAITRAAPAALVILIVVTLGLITAHTALKASLNLSATAEQAERMRGM